MKQLEQLHEFFHAGARCVVGFVPGHPGIMSDGLPGHWVGYVEVPVLTGIVGHASASYRDAGFPEYTGVTARPGYEVFGWDSGQWSDIRTQDDAIEFTRDFLGSPLEKKGFPSAHQVARSAREYDQMTEGDDDGEPDVPAAQIIDLFAALKQSLQGGRK